ncbi:MAG TPA: hypothetical protein VFV97_07660, partial [Rhodanobacteraceae bacterium]|nr:hypothetical protein [Rhodanobacteraceae bacterium]
AGTLAACHRAAAPTDAQLTNLLRVPSAQPNDPRAPLDTVSVDCLRAWSGDADLAKGLSTAMGSDTIKKTCKQRVDGWIADASRNPDKLTFADVSAPPTVRQAMALLQQHRSVAAAMPSKGDQPPPMMMRQGATNGAPAPTLPKGPVDMSSAAKELTELDGLCQQAKDAAASNSTSPMARYAPMCDRRIAQLRERVMQLQANGGTTREAELVSDNVHRMLTFGRKLSTVTTAPPNPAAPAPAPPQKN